MIGILSYLRRKILRLYRIYGLSDMRRKILRLYRICDLSDMRRKILRLYMRGRGVNDDYGVNVVGHYDPYGYFCVWEM